MLDPGLFPAGENFFQSHASLTLFPDLIAASVRLGHLSLEWALLLWQWLSIFLLLLACWQLSSKCFAEATARWCGVALLAALLTLPVAGTSLYIFDQYVVVCSCRAKAAITQRRAPVPHTNSLPVSIPGRSARAFIASFWKSCSTATTTQLAPAVHLDDSDRRRIPGDLRTEEPPMEMDIVVCSFVRRNVSGPALTFFQQRTC